MWLKKVISIVLREVCCNISTQKVPGASPLVLTKNGTLYVEYKALADEEEKVFFGGRLGEYKYYYTDATIAAVLEMCENVYDSSIMIEKTGAIQ